MWSSVTRYPSRCLLWALVCALGLSGSQSLAVAIPSLVVSAQRDCGSVTSLLRVPPLLRNMLYLVNVSEKRRREVILILECCLLRSRQIAGPH